MTRLLALALLPMLFVQSAQATSARCTALGSTCWCDEPLDTNTVDRFVPPSTTFTNEAWPGTVGNDDKYLDPTDSTTKECDAWETGYPAGLTIYNDPGTEIDAVAASGQPLPSGHTLTYVIKRTGTATGKIVGKRLIGSAGTTYCQRSYQRWDATSDVPDRVRCDSTPPGSGPGGGCSEDTVIKQGSDLDNSPVCAVGCVPYHEQYKTASLAGAGINLQLRTDVDFSPGHADHGALAAASLAAPMGTFPTPNGTLLNGAVILKQAHCTSNFCRIETCFDHLANGKARARYRVQVLSPGTPATYVGPTSGDSTGSAASIDASGDANNFNDVEFFTQMVTPGGVAIRYVTGVIFLNAALDESLWPGCDSAVEGPGCNDATGVFSAGGSPGGAIRWGRQAWADSIRSLEQIALRGWRTVLLPQVGWGT